MKNRVKKLFVWLLLAAMLLAICACGKKSVDGPAVSERTKQIYSAVVSTQGQYSATTSLITKPDGYPEKVGSVLAMMMSLHKGNASYLYHVAFALDGAVSTKETICEQLKDPDALYADEWIEIASAYPQETSETQQSVLGWYYFLFTADEIRTLANAGIRCLFIGSGKGITEDVNKTDGLDREQALERICQWAGDSFHAKTGG